MKKNNIQSFIKSKFNLTDEQVVDFLIEFYEKELLDTAETVLENFADNFPKDFDFEKITDEQKEYIASVHETVKHSDLNTYAESMDKIFKSMFAEYQSETVKHLFEGKIIVPHIKDNASATSRKCNGVFCEVVTYNNAYIYVKNQLDNNAIYCIAVSELEKD